MIAILLAAQLITGNQPVTVCYIAREYPDRDEEALVMRDVLKQCLDGSLKISRNANGAMSGISCTTRTPAGPFKATFNFCYVDKDGITRLLK